LYINFIFIYSYYNNNNNNNNNCYQENIHAMIAEREKIFFREISLNPQLKDQHPLMHLISAQQKLKMVDEQSGVAAAASKSASQKKSVF